MTTRETKYIASDDGVSFSRGVMRFAGVTLKPVRVEHWESTNGLTTYTTVAWEDKEGNLRSSCNCPGWTIKRGDTRECKHTKDMEGRKTCHDNNVDSINVTSIKVAVDSIPEMVSGDDLRAFSFEEF